jgi:aspartate dehydrogenase
MRDPSQTEKFGTMTQPTPTPLRVGLGGLGAIGLPVARWLDGGVDGLRLAAVSANNRERAESRMAALNNPVPVVGLAELAGLADVVVEGLPPNLFDEIAEPAIDAGRIFMPLSVTSLLARSDLIERAQETGARIIVPTGALLGLDAVRAAAYGTIHSVVMKTRKPPRGLQKATFVVEQGIDVMSLTEPKRLYAGTVTEAAKLFPANVNVACALSLAGIGPDKTQYEVWADPGVERNTHTISVDSDTVTFEMTTGVVPTEENPATGKLTPLSVMATLEGLVSTLKIGT